jgi:predicted esterase
MIAKQLRDQGVETQLEIFSGGHTVKPELVEKAAVFLSEH